MCTARVIQPGRFVAAINQLFGIDFEEMVLNLLSQKDIGNIEMLKLYPVYMHLLWKNCSFED